VCRAVRAAPAGATGPSSRRCGSGAQAQRVARNHGCFGIVRGRHANERQRRVSSPLGMQVGGRRRAVREGCRAPRWGIARRKAGGTRRLGVPAVPCEAAGALPPHQARQGQAASNSASSSSAVNGPMPMSRRSNRRKQLRRGRQPPCGRARADGQVRRPPRTLRTGREPTRDRYTRGETT